MIYTSDQGFANGEHGLRQKVAPYEATYASPLIVSFPGKIPSGRYCSHSVNGPDLVVTMFAWAGIELPWKMHGRDFTRLLLDPQDSSWDHATLYEHTGEAYGTAVMEALNGPEIAKHAGVPYYVAIRQGRWKYVYYLQQSESDELYDLQQDPEEQTNLATAPEYQEQRGKLLQILRSEVQRTEAQFAAMIAAN